MVFLLPLWGAAINHLCYNLPMEELNKSQRELADAVFEMSGETHGPNRHIVRAIAYQIESNARLEESINNFSKVTSKTEKIMIGLAFAQVLLAIATLASS